MEGQQSEHQVLLKWMLEYACHHKMVDIASGKEFISPLSFFILYFLNSFCLKVLHLIHLSHI